MLEINFCHHYPGHRAWSSWSMLTLDRRQLSFIIVVASMSTRQGSAIMVATTRPIAGFSHHSCLTQPYGAWLAQASCLLPRVHGIDLQSWLQLLDTVNERRITERRITERRIIKRRITERRITERRITERRKLPNAEYYRTSNITDRVEYYRSGRILQNVEYYRT